MATYDREPIAVVGIGCRFPGDISSVKEFWETLRNGLNVVSDVPSDRFKSESFYDPDPQKYGTMRNHKGGFVDAKAFDAEFFGIYPTEASRIDPQQRLALEASVHAVDDSGTTLGQISGSQTGVFFGTFIPDHLCVQSATEQRDNISPHVALGSSSCAVANRLSHRLNLHGPSLTLDTACSSSLVSLHLACQSIWTRESDAAIAGGVNVILRPESTVLMSKAGFLSPDGACKSFDAAGNGYVRSEGVGSVFLKPLSQALQSKDRIYALIRGSLVNQDGHTADGFTVPNPTAQAKLLQSIYSQSGIDPAMVCYIEAHGPGTPVGDPIEAKTLGKQLGRRRPQCNDPLWIGSIKANMGHLEGAAGIAGFIKAALIAFHGEIPPQIKHKNPNPSIDFRSLRLAVSSELVSLPSDRKKSQYVGVNSFGAGGTNAHAILETPPDSNDYSKSSKSKHVPRTFVLSARSASALENAARDLSSYVRNYQPALEDVAYTINMRRSIHSHVSIIPAEQSEELCRKLDHLGSGQASPKEIFSLRRRNNFSPKVAFIFSGQGGQWLGMGTTLKQRNSIFCETIDAFDNIFTQLAGFSIREEMSASNDDLSRLDETTVVQPAVVAMQIAQARMLISYGIKPGAVVGHSIGEVSAAHIAGAISFEEAVRIIYFRSQTQNRASGSGTMLATGLSSTEAEGLIQRRQIGQDIEIAALNGLQMTVLTGKTTVLEQVARELDTQSILARFVKVDVPYHSRFMDAFEDDLINKLSFIQGQKAHTHLYSTVTGSQETGTHVSGRYWFENVRKPVLFVETVKRLLEDGFNFLVEVGPHPVLVSGATGVAETLKSPCHVIPAMVRRREADSIAWLMGAAHAVGVNVDIHSFNGDGGHQIGLPLYPFQKQYLYFENPEVERSRLGKSKHPFLGKNSSLTDDGRGLIWLRLSTGVSPFLTDHVIDGSTIFPMTGHIEAAYLAASIYMPESRVRLEGLQFEHPLVLETAENFAPQVLFEITSPANDFVISSRAANSDPAAALRVCSRGRINAFDQKFSFVPEALGKIRSFVQTGTELDVEDFYRKLELAGIRYGESFRSVRKAWQLGANIVSFVKIPDAFKHEATNFRFHPALLDACLHTMYIEQHRHGDFRFAYLPYMGDFIEISQAHGITSAFVHVFITGHNDSYIKGNVSVYSEDGKVIGTFIGITTKSIKGRHLSPPTEYRVGFQRESRDESSSVDVNFQNVLLYEPRPDNLEWIEIIRETFPHARIQRKPLESIEKPGNNTELELPLDRRALLFVPALVSDTNQYESLDAINKCLLDISTLLHEKRGTPDVVVVTKAGCLTPMDSQCDPFSSSIEAAVRVIANELPQSRFRVIDLAIDQDSQKSPLLIKELQTLRLSRYESVVALRSKSSFVKRVLPIDANDDNRANILPARGGSYTCKPDSSGSLEDIKIQEQPPANLGPDDVGIEVHSAGLNFKDVLNGLGMLSEQSVSDSLTEYTLGGEVAGRVVSIGENVHNIHTGDLVMARVRNGLSGFVVTNAKNALHVPPHISSTEASCLLLAFVTAYYSLVYLGRLAPGESVLVHSAAGGVGIAAIQIAKLTGSRVYATAGSPSRRAWVAEMGVERVFDSRSLSLRDDIMCATQDRGVDIVLNSLAGPMLSQSFLCLAPFGRFLEIGKTDIYRNMRIGLQQFGQNRSYFAIDIDRLALQKPELNNRMLCEVGDLLYSRKLVPPPITKYPITDISKAMKEFSRSSIIGKAAVEMPENATIQAAPQIQISLRTYGSYLITGGTSGVGLHLAKLLFERGARYIVLVSRSGPKSQEDYASISDLQHRGATVRVERVDIANSDNVASLFQCLKDWPPIAGIIHSAGVLDDAYSYDITISDFWKVFTPKAIGAWNLHLATKNMELDFFVLISSASSVLALIGQYSYASANRFLDGLAQHRRMLGLPGTSLNLGVLGNYAGMSQKSELTDKVSEILEASGLSPISLLMVRSIFERAILRNSTQRLAAHLDWSRFLTSYANLSHDGTFLGLENQTGTENSNSNTVLSLRGPERIEAIVGILRSGLARVVGIETDKIFPAEEISQYASDSITLTQLRGTILREFRVAYLLMRLFEGPSIDEIALEIESSFQDSSSKNQASSETIGDNTQSLYQSGLSVISRWCVRGNSANSSKPKLLCIHSMGTAASLFSTFLTDPPRNLDPIAIQWPGRETRADEECPTDLFKMVPEIFDEIVNVIGIPHIIWGHSFGGIIAFEVLRALRRHGKPLPRLLLTGTIAPHLIRNWQKRDVMLQIAREDYSAEYFLAISRYVADMDFSRAILPLMRKDASLLLNYQFIEEDPLDLSITAFAASQDDMVYPDEVEAWKEHAMDFRLTEVTGDHWFILPHRKLLREKLEEMAE